MAELVIGPLVSMVKEKASSYLLDQYKVMEGMEEQRTILERKLPAILDIIQDAEEKGAFRPGVQAWLKDLKKVSYQANDVFDEFKYEALRREAEKKGHYNIKTLRRFPTRNPIVFRYRMGKKLQKIVQTIEVLVTEMNTFGFRHMQQAPRSKQWRKTDSIMVESDKDIISRSREEEKKIIMKILLDEASSKDLVVLPIVGMGGLGKTTFVQLVYNDLAIMKYFDLRGWCCVSDDFDAATIASGLCQSQTNINDKGREKALQGLQSMISGNRYLIVLDDVWDLDDDKWGKLKTCLKHGGKGSVVLTTTRNDEIARRMTMGVPKAYNIKELGDEYLKEIVQNRAFSLEKPNHDELDGMLDKIVERCVGSPLAAKAFGSMLSTKTNINQWEDALAKSNICNGRTGILPILKLSFDDLPSDMKQCFAFCAIFPKDYEIDMELLIQLWMAHELIPVQEDDHPETTGESIFRELTWRSFFQDVKQTSPVAYTGRLQLRDRTICKIHDLMHDIALSVAKKECVTIVDMPIMRNLLPNSAVHLFSVLGGTLLNDFLKKHPPTLRTLFIVNGLFYENGAFVVRCIANYTALRALHLPKELGTKIQLRGQILHLRYLDLSNNSELERLPEDISIMYNLQTLNISHCNNLHQLPKDMKYMASLQHLYTNGCESLTCMPPALGHITSLQILTYFVVGASSGCSTIGELEKLNLDGELGLSCLENATEDHAKAASLENKKKLTHLSLGWNSKGQEPEQDCHKKVLHALKPHAGLQTLKIVNYKGTSLPTWITDLSNLTKLHLLGCVLCEEFPQFLHFKALQVLYLEKLDKLLSLCCDVGFMTFPALKELYLHDLESLDRWVAPEGKELTFPVLEKLVIKNCPKLTSLPEAPNLKDIMVDEDKALLSLAVLKSKHVSSMSKIELSTRDTEATLPQIDENHESSVSELMLQSGFHFFFSSSPPQAIFGAWKWFGKLVTLAIFSCDAMIYWPEDVFQCLVSLKNLRIGSCNKLVGRRQVKGGDPTQTADQVLPHLNMIHIRECESLTELFVLPQSLRTITIFKCPRLESVWRIEEHSETNTDIQLEYCRDLASTSMLYQFPCLEDLFVLECDRLATLPNLPPSLKRLNIWSCRKLCSVSGHLESLEILRISGCSNLQSLGYLGGMPSLESLYLYGCPCLASLPGVLGSYSALRLLTVRHCPAIDLKPLYKRHQERLDRLEHKDISHAHSSDPKKGPKLSEPRSWKYVIPGVQDWTSRHEVFYG